MAHGLHLCSSSGRHLRSLRASPITATSAPHPPALPHLAVRVLQRPAHGRPDVTLPQASMSAAVPPPYRHRPPCARLPRHATAAAIVSTSSLLDALPPMPSMRGFPDATPPMPTTRVCHRRLSPCAPQLLLTPRRPRTQLPGQDAATALYVRGRLTTPRMAPGVGGK
ncbi:hypothetical protein BS78_02G244800 [Paspalum vaginatum]|nr:hypothetical protein BS78_02G244800 [Paspalum vaginatum]